MKAWEQEIEEILETRDIKWSGATKLAVGFFKERLNVFCICFVSGNNYYVFFSSGLVKRDGGGSKQKAERFPGFNPLPGLKNRRGMHLDLFKLYFEYVVK